MGDNAGSSNFNKLQEDLKKKEAAKRAAHEEENTANAAERIRQEREAQFER